MIKQLKKNINLFLFLISAFAASNIFSSTNNIYSDYQKKIDELKKTFASQWDILTKDTGEFTASINDNVKKYSRFDRLELLDKLMKRIKDKNDPLDNLDKYESALYGGGDANLIYNAAYAMIRKGDIKRSVKLFKFLINDKNPSGFTVGNSHYWYAYYLYYIQKDRTNALNHYLMVHKYSSCLVFTDAAYCRAARIYNELGKPDIALALYSVQIPHIDYWKNELLKAESSYKICISTCDITNAVYQVQRLNKALRFKPLTNYYSSKSWEGKIEKIILKKLTDNKIKNYKDKNNFLVLPSFNEANRIYNSISNYVSKCMVSENYELQCIENALDKNPKINEKIQLEDMLLHDWPFIEDVDDVILTNRTLSNNIFEQKRRKR